MYKITINDYNIEVECADTFKKRLFGLMGKKKFSGLLFKQKYSNRFFSSIHTSFMLVPIDLIYIDKNMRISQTTTLNPWNIFIPKDDNTKYILELPENSIKNNDIKVNNTIKIKKNIKK
jgi:uncharacterized membrane protein (UPF0127 family)